MRPVIPKIMQMNAQKQVTIDDGFYKRLISKKKNRFGGLEFVDVPKLNEFRLVEPNFGWRNSQDYILQRQMTKRKSPHRVKSARVL